MHDMNHDDLDHATEQVTLDDTRIASLALLDHSGVDWGRVQRTAYLIHQHLRYEYPGPIENLRHRLVVIPPTRLGDQRRVVHRIDVTGADAVCAESEDAFGNVVVTVDAPYVARWIDFEAWTVVERGGGAVPRVEGWWLVDPRLCEPSTLTRPDDALRAAAARLSASDGAHAEIAVRINDWVSQTLRYEHGATHVHTTAGEALALGRGVCQDFAHVMIALVRSLGIPCRYVSGYLFHQREHTGRSADGATHAWVEVFLPGSGWVGFDPTNNMLAGDRHIRVAIGRDYADVPPTHGIFRGKAESELSVIVRIYPTELPPPSADLSLEADWVPAPQEGYELEEGSSFHQDAQQQQ